MRRFTLGQKGRWYDIEDFALIKRIQAGDTEAFDVLVRKYYGRVYQFCYRRLNGDADAAADITQEVFLKLLENIQAVRMLGKFRNYLLTIAVNTCNNHFKKSKSAYTDLEPLEIADGADSSFEKMIRDENKLEVRQAVDALPGYQKEVIILRFYHELKIREIAKVTGASIPTVKSRLQQGIKKLRRCLGGLKESGSI